MKRKIFWTCAVFVVVFVAATALKVKAEPVGGSSFIGGFSEDNNMTGQGLMYTGVEWISASGTGHLDGLDIPTGDGPVTGYAWGSNVEWIDFNPQAHCYPDPDGNTATLCTPPAGKYCAASCTDPNGGLGGVSRSSNNLIGWARFVGVARESAAGNSGGWDGWIKMEGDGSNGVKVNPVNANKLQGYAWNGEGVVSGNPVGFGWLDFSGVNINCTPVYGPAQCATSAPDMSTCGASNAGQTISGTATCNQYATGSCAAPAINHPLSDCSGCSIPTDTCPNVSSGSGNYIEVAP